MLRLPNFALGSLEEMPGGLLAGILVGHHHTAHLVVLLEHADHPLKERLRERVINHVGRVVAHHFLHVIIHNVPVDLFEPQKVFAGEVGPVPVIE